MKPSKYVIYFILACIIIGGTPVLAQQIDPPRESTPVGEPIPYPEEIQPEVYTLEPAAEEGALTSEEARLSEFGETGVMVPQEPPVITLPEGIALAGEGDLASEFSPENMPAEMPLLEKEGETRSEPGVGLSTVYKSTSLIGIATSLDHEWLPAVAHGGSSYMVVYTHNGNIYGKLVSNAGNLVKTFVVADHTNNCSNPSVAYDPRSNLYLVTYQYYWNPDYDVRVVAVSPITGKVGGWWAAGSSTVDERYPDIACNTDNQECLVVYQYNVAETIKGRYFKIDDMGIIAASASVYNMTDASNAQMPYIAWGKDTGTFFITYTWWDSTFELFAMYTHVYDQLTSATPKHIHNNSYVVLPTFGVDGHSKIASDVAYDPCTDKYIPVWYYNYSGDGSDYDIYVSVKDSWYATNYGDYKYVAATSSKEYLPKIAFVTDGHLPAACGTMDKLVVTYINDDRGVVAGDLRGNNSTVTPLYVSDGSLTHLLIDDNNTVHDMRRTAISPGSSFGELFVVFEMYWKYDGDSDIWARIINVRSTDFKQPYFVPLVAR